MNQFKFGLCLLVALLVAACTANAGLNDIKNRFRSIHHGGQAAAASAAVGGSVPTGGYYPPQQPGVQQQFYRPAPPQPLYGGSVYPPQSTGYVPQGAYRYGGSVPEPLVSRQYGQQPYYAPAPVVHSPIPRVAPRFVQHTAPKFNAGSASSSAALGGGAAASAAGAAGGLHGGNGGSAAASSAAAAGGRNGGAAASSAVSGGGSSGSVHSINRPVDYNSRIVDTEEYNEHYDEPETLNTFGSQAGTYANDGNGLETSSYVRNTEDIVKHEDGKEDDDHYYNAQSYGKTYDENKHEAYNNDDEDILHTPTVFRKKKSNTNYVSDFNKARRESGSGVLAHDKHSASYNKNSKKFNENVDQRYHREGEGIVDSQDFSSNQHIDDEDEEQFDNRGLGNFVGVDGIHHAKRPMFNAQQAAAASSAAGGGNGAAATSAAASGRR